MKGKLIGLFQNLKEIISGNFKEQSQEEKMVKSVREAHREWLAKEEYFNHATDPDLVDFAIYDIEASKRKYVYLLKKAKEEKNM